MGIDRDRCAEVASGAADKATNSACVPTASVAPTVASDRTRARLLVLSAVLRGLVLDDPWRHVYLRNRWIGL
jgi:hypothetical protein